MNIQAAEHAISLRPYQEEDRTKTVDAFLGKGITRGLGVWPTGGGKTVMFSELHLEPRMQQWIRTFPTHKQKILVLAHREELLSQARDKILRSNPDLIVDIEQADKRASLMADVIVASVPTLTASKGKRMHKFHPEQFRLVVVDEAHHATAPGYLAILQYFGFLPPATWMKESMPSRAEGKNALLEWQRAKLESWDRIGAAKDRFLLGVTATPERGDGVGLEAVFQEIVFQRSIRDLMQMNYLCRLRAFRVETTTSLDAVQTRAGDFAQEQLASAVNEAVRNAKAVKAYKDYAEGRKGVTFCVNVAHAMSMAQAYNEAGVPAAAIHGGLNEERRKEILTKFASGEIKMVTNCQILTEGTDIPDIGVIIHARPTKSKLLYVQMTGRGLRIHPGKLDCIVIDIVDLTRKHSLITAPELLGLPIEFNAKGEDLLDAKVKLEKAEEDNPLLDLSHVQSLDDIQIQVEEVDLLGSFHDPLIDQFAQLSWRKTGEGFTLEWRGELLNERLDVVQQKDGSWEARHYGDARGTRTKWKSSCATDLEAVKQAESYLQKNQNGAHTILKKNVPWKAAPATNFQKDNLQKLGYKLNWDKLTRGEAANIIQLYHAKKERTA
jgi:superfamily II DNA or RNA helicase